MRISFIVFLWISIFFPATAQNRYYVNAAATGSAQTGQSWTDAFTDLHKALAAAVSGDTIWVAAGIYTPTLTNERTVSFVLPSGVGIYGGFSGTETGLAERDIVKYQTVLSGDIGMHGVRTDNSYHVVRGEGLDNNTVFDGFVIRDGYSYNDFAPIPLDRYGAGMLLVGVPGLADSRPLIQNCIFEYNQAYDGGALCATWNDFGSPSVGEYPVNPVLRNCTFRSNLATSYGGALYKNSPTVADPFLIEDCRFLDNKAYTGQGGGIYFNSPADSKTVIRRCLFERDTSWGDAGGAIAFYGNPLDSSTSWITLDSCTFRRNLALEGGAFLFDGYHLGQGIPLRLNCRISNCRFEENVARSSNGSAFYFLVTYFGNLYTEIEDCVFEGNLARNITVYLALSESNNSILKVNRCTFFNNRSISGPNQVGMVLNHGGGLNNTVLTEVSNCLFFNNGGGVASTSASKNFVTTKVSNCTFFENNEYIFVKTWDILFNQPSGYYNDFYIDNCIVWEPASSLRKMFYNNQPLVSNMYGYNVNHSLLSLADSTSVPGATEAFQSGLLWGRFPEFQDSLAGNFRLKPCSPAVNKGNNAVVFDLDQNYDLDALPRIRYGTVDLGAYEQQDSCLSVSTNTVINGLPLSVWPNPLSEGYVHFNGLMIGQGAAIFQVFDMHGRQVFQTKTALVENNIVDLSHLQAGVYTVRLLQPDRVFSGVLVKQ